MELHEEKQSNNDNQKPGAFLFRYEIHFLAFFISNIHRLPCIDCVFTQGALLVAAAVNVIVPIAMSLL